MPAVNITIQIRLRITKYFVARDTYFFTCFPLRKFQFIDISSISKNRSKVNATGPIPRSRSKMPFGLFLILL